jgi:hypothetical protein
MWGIPMREHNISSLSYFVRLSCFVCLVTLSSTLLGCAVSPDAPYPSTGSISDIGQVLTPEEQKKAVSDLRKDGRVDERSQK